MAKPKSASYRPVLIIYGLVAGGRPPADPQSRGAAGSQHVPDAIAYHRGCLDLSPKPLGGGKEKIRIWLRVFHLVTSNEGIRSKSTRSASKAGRAVSIRPLVATAQGISASVK